VTYGNSGVINLNGFLLKASKIIIGDGTTLDDSNIVVQDGRITRVAQDIIEKQDLEVLDYSDRVVMPGIIDTHIHFCHDGNIADPALSSKLSDEYLAIRGSKFAEQLLEFGVTTCGDAAARGNVSFAIRQAIEKGVVKGPQVLVCGRMITITGGRDRIYGPSEADGPTDMRRATREELSRGVDFIKLAATGAITSESTEGLSAQFDMDEMQAAVEEAHKVGKPVHAHSYGDDGAENSILAGVDVLVHGHPLSQKSIDLLKQHSTMLMPTLVTYYESQKHHDEGVLPDYIVRKEKELFPLIEAGFRNAVKHDVEIVLGSDSGMPFTPFGRSSPEELEVMVKLGGMSEMQAIVAGTQNASRALNIDAKVGTIEAGKSADLLILSSGIDPLEEISTLQQPESIEKVILHGRVVE
jgi:imidazolonepropionase-like amidohydrolase